MNPISPKKPFYSSAEAISIRRIPSMIADFEEELQKIATMPMDPKRKQLAIFEMISKWLSYHVLAPADTVSLPVFINNAFQFIPFEPILVTLPKGTTGYLLRPHVDIADGVPISPIFIFRGTSIKYCSGSVVADIGIKAWANAFFSLDLTPALRAGSAIYEGTRRKTNLFVEEFGRSATFLGHSLGGTIASEVGVTMDHVQELCTFNSPGVSRKAARTYQKRQSPMNATSVETKGDPIKIFAQSRKIGEPHKIEPDKSLQLSKSNKHGACLLATSSKVEKTPCQNTALKVTLFVLKLIFAIPWRVLLLLFFLVSMGAELYHLSGAGDPLKAVYSVANEVFELNPFCRLTYLDRARDSAEVYIQALSMNDPNLRHFS